MERLHGAFRWFKITSMLIGAPVVMLLVLVGAQKFLFTTICYAAGTKCEYAIGASDGMAQYMGDLLDANPGADIVARPRRR